MLATNPRRLNGTELALVLVSQGVCGLRVTENNCFFAPHSRGPMPWLCDAAALCTPVSPAHALHTHQPRHMHPSPAHHAPRTRAPDHGYPKGIRHEQAASPSRAIEQSSRLSPVVPFPSRPVDRIPQGPYHGWPGKLEWGSSFFFARRCSCLFLLSLIPSVLCLRLFLRHGCPPFSRQLVADDSETCARHSRLIPYHSASINFNRLAGGRRTAPGRELQLPGSRVLGLGLVSTYIYLRGTALLLDAISCRTRRSGLNACGTD